MLLAKNAAFRPRTQRLRVQQASVCCFSSRKTKTSHCEPQGPPPDPSTFSPSAYEPRPFFRFELIHQSKLSLARVGRIHTPHGVIDTPGYVAVASKCSRLCVSLLYTDLTPPLAANGALKGVTFDDADLTGQQLVFANTYHLMLQPGADTVGQAGGLHKYVNRAKDKPFITDSGGFQVFSLAYGSVHEELSTGGELKRASKGGRSNNTSHSNGPPVKVTEEGVVFKSYRDGAKVYLSPESTVQAQKQIGADIIIPLDELPPYHIDPKALEASVERTHRWEARSLREHLKDIREQAMYCVIHGGLDRTLRKKSIDYLTSLPFDGFAIGGSLGKNKGELLELLEWLMPQLNENGRGSKPRHLLGIADEPSILGAVKQGIDTLDSCYPTRISRHGTLLTREGKINIKSGKYAKQYGVPVDPECGCAVCKKYDRAYLNHLFKAREPLFIQLSTIHNLQYMNDLMKEQRQLILDGKL